MCLEKVFSGAESLVLGAVQSVSKYGCRKFPGGAGVNNFRLNEWFIFG